MKVMALRGRVRRNCLLGLAAVLAVGGGLISQAGVASAQDGVNPSFYTDISNVPDNFDDTAVFHGPSGGTFSVDCGRDQNNHHNSDNYIVSPRVVGGAGHVHDYVGNDTTNAFSTNASLAQGQTTCANGDQSPYVWPVLRLVTGDSPQSGTIVEPDLVLLKFRGNAHSKVVAMPRFLRIITGDAKAATDGDAFANENWTCSNTRHKRSSKYPLCTTGGELFRVLDFPSCWDGKDLDSSNHRTHIVFTKPDEDCPRGTVAVPELHVVLGYNIAPKPDFVVDTMSMENFNPATDHSDFENVMRSDVMDRVVGCLNAGPGHNCQE